MTIFAACCYMLLLQALSFSSRVSVLDVVLLVVFSSGECDKVNICLEPRNDYGFDSVEDSGDEDFVGMLFIKLIVYFSVRS